VPGNEQHLPEIGCGWVEFADHQAARNRSRLISAGSGLLKQHNANRRTYFFNAIDPKRRAAKDLPHGNGRFVC